tara:strand:- start:540 stop:671 length:132 start_codon:yes stop_codon:yes gene_type:complete
MQFAGQFNNVQLEKSKTIFKDFRKKSVLKSDLASLNLRLLPGF